MGKIQPFKALGNVAKAAAPFASFIPGVSPLAGAGIGFLGSMLGGGGGFSGGGGGGPNMYRNEQATLMAQILPLLKDPGLAVSGFQRDAFGRASQTGGQLGGLVAQQTGNPGAEGAIRLGEMNRATEATNRFASDVYSPAGRAQAAMGVLPFYQGMANQSLQRYQIGQQYQRPTFLESLTGVGANVLPYYLDYLDRQGGQSNNVGSKGANPTP